MKRPFFIARHDSKPVGLLGALVSHAGARHTRAANIEALRLLNLNAEDRFLDMGTGTGASLTLASECVADGLVVGVDHSPMALTCARLRNWVAVRRGNVRLVQARTNRLPAKDSSFTKILAMHTIYFWSDPQEHFREARRVLAPGGQLLVGFHTHGTDANRRRYPRTVYQFHQTGAVIADLQEAGFDPPVIETQEDHNGARLCLMLAQVPTGAP